VLRALVTVSRSGAEPTARVAAIAQFADRSPERSLVEALLDPQVRLLVATGDSTSARVRLAHEALITHWDRAKQHIAQDRRDLETRDLVERQHTRWSQASRLEARKLLLRDPDLANAAALARRWGDEIDAPTRAYIAASRRRARLLQQSVLIAAAVFATVAILAGWQYRKAEQQRMEADLQRSRAQVALDLAEQRGKEADRQRARAQIALDLVMMEAADKPAFDCNTDKTKDEAVICSDVLLAQWDNRVAFAYTVRRTESSGAALYELQNSQRGFLRRRAQCGTSGDVSAVKACTLGLMKERVIELIGP
jgi:hypothetical protein